MSFRIDAFYLALLAVLYLANAKVVHNKPALEIIHGEETVPHSAPFVVHLTSVKRDVNTGRNVTGLCTASRISNEYIVTAKHCIENAYFTNVELGKHHTNTGDPGQVIVSSNDYYTIQNSRFNYDIALIKLPFPVNDSRTIRNITLPLKRNSHVSYEGNVGIAYGWGQTEDGSSSPVLLQATLPVMSTDECNYALAYHHAHPQLRAYEFCTSGLAGDINKGTCHGDSGGPFVVDGVLVGMTVRGRYDCKHGAPSVFISLGYYLQWIENVTGIIFN